MLYCLAVVPSWHCSLHRLLMLSSAACALSLAIAVKGPAGRLAYMVMSREDSVGSPCLKRPAAAVQHSRGTTRLSHSCSPVPESSPLYMHSALVHDRTQLYNSMNMSDTHKPLKVLVLVPYSSTSRCSSSSSSPLCAWVGAVAAACQSCRVNGG